METVEIGLAANAPYFCGMIVTACSIAKYAGKKVEGGRLKADLGKGCRLSYNILDGGLSEEQKAFMERRVRAFHSDSTFRYLPVNDELFKDYPAWHGNKMAYARLMLPTALPEVDWIIYCDVDFLWLRDIGELWEEKSAHAALFQQAARTPLPPCMASQTSQTSQTSEIAFIGVLDNHLPTRLSEKKWFEERGYPFDLDDYFCSGLCFMNLKAFREEKLVDRIMEVLDRHKDIQFPDQAALNIVTWGRRRLVDGRWQRFIADLTRVDVERGVVIHHAGNIPWKPLERKIHLLCDATMLWHRMNAEIYGISTWQSLRRWLSVPHILWHRGLYFALQVPPVRFVVRNLCERCGHPGVWTGLEWTSRRIGHRGVGR